jgi:CRISPR type IV-associated protein Csf3
MMPLKITAYPRCGIESDEHLPIDAILYYAAMREKYGPLVLSTPGHRADVDDVALPLQRTEIHGEWFYCASFAQWGPHTDGQTFWAKRFDRKQEDLIDFGKRRGKVITEQGRYKAYKMPTFYRHAVHVSWFVVGERGAIEELLSPMTHIGKKAAQGAGRIIRWCVEPASADCSIYDADNRLMRAIPNPKGILYGIRPSYWLRSNQALCMLPLSD